MILGYITTLEIEDLERCGVATITEKPAKDGVVSFPLIFEQDGYRSNQRLLERIAELQSMLAMADREHRRIVNLILDPVYQAKLLQPAPARILSCDCQASRVRAHLVQRIDEKDFESDARYLMTDDQALATWERMKASRNASYVAAIFAKVPQ